MNTVLLADGARLAYEHLGKGEAIILVGGALDAGTRSFPAMIALAQVLASWFAVVAYDRRERGESGDRVPCTVSGEVGDIEALIGTAGGSAHLYGFSSGAAEELGPVLIEFFQEETL